MNFITGYVCTSTSLEPGRGCLNGIALYSTQKPLTNAGSLVTTELIPLFALAAEGPGLVVADSVRAAALRILSALIVV